MDAPSSMPTAQQSSCLVNDEVHDSIAYDIKPTPLTQPTIQYDVNTQEQQNGGEQPNISGKLSNTSATSSGGSVNGGANNSTPPSNSGASAAATATGRNRQRVKPEGSGPGRPLTADRRRPYPCDLCPSRFGSKMELEEHQNRFV